MKIGIRKSLFVLAILCCTISLKAQRPGACQVDKYLSLLQGKRVAVCANQTSLVEQKHLVDTLLSYRINVKKIFCPEHGFRGKAEAGAHIASSTDSRTGLPIISLYGNNKKPQPEQMKDLDVVVFDLQDVGCRFYTYISTLHYVMEAAAENHVQVVVLDRPNPNGYFVDGPVLEPKYRSFVGMHPVPVVYGMTIGEYAQMINGEGWLANGAQCDLTVVPIAFYNHDTRYALPVAPSPNLPTEESIYLYPSLCFFEGTNISIGRGTFTPFEIYGSPTFQEGDYTFTPKPIPGVSENPPCKNQTCKGFQLTEIAKEGLRKGDNQLQLDYLLNAYRLYPNKENFFTNASFFDKLAGTDQLRKQIAAGKTAEEIRQSWKPGLDSFMTVREKYLLYPDFSKYEDYYIVKIDSTPRHYFIVLSKNKNDLNKNPEELPILKYSRSDGGWYDISVNTDFENNITMPIIISPKIGVETPNVQVGDKCTMRLLKTNIEILDDSYEYIGLGEYLFSGNKYYFSENWIDLNYVPERNIQNKYRMQLMKLEKEVGAPVRGIRVPKE